MRRRGSITKLMRDKGLSEADAIRVIEGELDTPKHGENHPTATSSQQMTEDITKVGGVNSEGMSRNVGSGDGVNYRGSRLPPSPSRRSSIKRKQQRMTYDDLLFDSDSSAQNNNDANDDDDTSILFSPKRPKSPGGSNVRHDSGSRKKRLSSMLMAKEDIANLLSLPPKQLAKEFHSRDKTVNALRRNVDHLVKLNDKDSGRIVSLTANLKKMGIRMAKLEKELEVS